MQQPHFWWLPPEEGLLCGPGVFSSPVLLCQLDKHGCTNMCMQNVCEAQKWTTGSHCAAWKADSLSGKIIHGYVMDRCADANFWCQTDTYHLDISKSYLSGKGLLSIPWNGRRVSWKFITGPAAGCAFFAHALYNPMLWLSQCCG
jgi:hypothetical protein